MSIRILVTGGTFDKEYNERTGQLYFKDTHIAEMLRLSRNHSVNIQSSIKVLKREDIAQPVVYNRNQRTILFSTPIARSTLAPKSIIAIEFL